VNQALKNIDNHFLITLIVEVLSCLFGKDLVHKNFLDYSIVKSSINSQES